jgi:hypothetical protein
LIHTPSTRFRRQTVTGLGRPLKHNDDVVAALPADLRIDAVDGAEDRQVSAGKIRGDRDAVGRQADLHTLDIVVLDWWLAPAIASATGPASAPAPPPHPGAARGRERAQHHCPPGPVIS